MPRPRGIHLAKEGNPAWIPLPPVAENYIADFIVIFPVAFPRTTLPPRNSRRIEATPFDIRPFRVAVTLNPSVLRPLRRRSFIRISRIS
jgi:hypothetical protein